MADAGNESFWRKAQAAIADAFKADDKNFGDKLRTAWDNLTNGQDSAADTARNSASRARDNLRKGYDAAMDSPRGRKVRETTDQARDKIRDTYNSAMDSDQGRKAQETATSILKNFREMGAGNKTAAALGGGMILEGTLSAANNARHGRWGRAFKAGARIGFGVLLEVAATKAHGNNQNIYEFGKSFVERELLRRGSGKANSQGHGV